MATIGATAVFVAAGPARALGLPRLRVANGARLRCRCGYSKDLNKKASSALVLAVVTGAPLLAEASSMMTTAGPVLAPAMVLTRVDERAWTDGSGLSNDLLGWILTVAFGVALSYTVYSSILDDDDDQSSGGGGGGHHGLKSTHRTAMFFCLPDP